MNAEIAVLQNELTIAQKNNEILELRHQLQVTQAAKASKLEDSLFSPELYEHYQKVAVMMSKSEIVPNAYRGKPADIFIAMEMGYQLGFPIAQSLQDIAVINGRPCLWGDGLLALVLSHPDCEAVKEEPLVNTKGDVIGYKCEVRRKGFTPREQIFTLQDAQTAGLLKKQGPWTQYPKRMLQMRARAFALRDVFGDALRGFKVVEEVQDTDVIDIEVTPSTATTQTEKLKQVLGINVVSNDEQEVSNVDSDDAQHASSEEISDTESKADESQIERIIELFDEKNFDEERVEKALAYYKVTNLIDLTFDTAQKFISQLEKV